MAKRTNRVAWGLGVGLVVGLAVGYTVWSAGAESCRVRLLKPEEWGFSRGGMGDNSDYAHPIAFEWVDIGFIRLAKVTRLPSPNDSTKSSTRSGTGR